MPETIAVDVKLPDLHPTQYAVAKSNARFRVVCCGRRWGKTVLGVIECIRVASKGGRVWWVAPTFKQSMEGWLYLTRIIATFPGARKLESKLTVTFSGGGSIEIKTSDDPDNLRGAGLDLVVLDEAASMQPIVWYQIIRPALADRGGRCVFIGTPKHFNWFYDVYSQAETDTTGNWSCWQHPTWDNPYIPQEEIDAAQNDMEPGDFDQEFGASFTAVGGAIWPLLSANRPSFLRPMPKDLDIKATGVGMDWGTTPQHHAAVVCASRVGSGQIWIRSAWTSPRGSSNDWFDEARRARKDHGATFARVDRSQSSAVDHLTSLGFEADKGTPAVEARIGDFTGLVTRYNIFWDINGPGVRDYYNHCCIYHRDDKGKVVEEVDDDVDAGCYVVSELVRPQATIYAPPTSTLIKYARTAMRKRLRSA